MDPESKESSVVSMLRLYITEAVDLVAKPLTLWRTMR